MIYPKTNELEHVIKLGSALSDHELQQLNSSLNREFGLSLQSKEQLNDRLFFLLKNNDEIIAFGALLTVNPVYFNGEEFSLMGFVNVVSNIKGKGYGKQIITKMIDYLRSNKKTAIGFTHPRNQIFYEKCGCIFPSISTKRFVTKAGETNQDGQRIFYVEGEDQFMQKVLHNQDSVITLPESTLW